MLGFPDFCDHFRILYGIPEFQEPSKNLPGARSSVLTQYQPISSHGDPIRPKYYHFYHFLPTLTSRRPAHFHYTSISPSTVLRIFGTHLEFFATPWYIDIFQTKQLLTVA